MMKYMKNHTSVRNTINSRKKVIAPLGKKLSCSVGDLSWLSIRIALRFFDGSKKVGRTRKKDDKSH